MDMQNVKNLTIPEGDVKMIHDKDNRLLWGAVGYDTKYAGDTFQQTYSGKNLLRTVASASTTTGGVTFTVNADGTITANGTATTGINFYPAGNANVYSIPAGIYTLSDGLTNPTSTTYFTYIDGAGTPYFWWNTAEGRITQTVPEGATIRPRIVIREGQTLNNVVFKLQLESGSTATPYEPYVGGTASPNPDYPQDVNVVTGEQTVGVTGKNLWNFRTKQEDWHASSTVVDDNSISVTGTTNNGAQSVTFSVPCKPNTTYTLTRTLNVITAGNDTGRIYIQDNNGYITNISISQSSKTFTTSATASKIVLIFFANVTGTPSTAPKVEFSNVQVEKGSTATTYEAYQGQSYEIGLDVGNMIDVDNFQIGGMSNGVPNPNTKYQINCGNNPIKVSPNTQYTISVNLGKTVKGMRVGVHSCDANLTFISDSGWKQLVPTAYTFTTGANVEYVKLIFSLSTTSSTVTTGGTEDTTQFTSVIDWFRGATVKMNAGSSVIQPIELCKIGTYQDYIYKSGDDWYVHKATGKAVFDGIEAWTSTSANNTTTMLFQKSDAISDALSIVATSNSYYLCNSFKTYNCYNSGNTDEGSCYHNDRKPMFRVKRSRLNTEDTTGWQTWLSTHNTTVYYVLATPTDTKITDSTLIGELEAVHEWMTRYGYQASVTGNLPMIIRQDALT